MILFFVFIAWVTILQHLNQFPIWRDANRLLLATEQAVRGFPRYHKYTLGADLRRQAMDVCRRVHRAFGASENQVDQVGALIAAVDDLKLSVQLGKELSAFRNFQEFQTIVELAVSVGRQGGGWRKRLRRQVSGASRG